MRSLVGLVALSAVLVVAPATAHTRLLSSDPIAGAHLATAPRAITLTFADPVTLARATLGAAGGATRTLALPPRSVAQAILDPGVLAPGHYRLDWRALGADGHVGSGHLEFTVDGRGGR